MVKKFLITGGLGFIGKNLVKSIIKIHKNYQITIIDNLSNSNIGEFKNLKNFNIVNINSNISSSKQGIFFYKGDILNKNLLDKTLKNIDVVIHLAANTGVELSILNPIEDLNKNILGTLLLLEYSKKHKIKKFIFSSSNAVAGETNTKISEITVTKPIHQYGVSKSSAEAYIYAYYKLYNMNTVILRFSNVYGPGSIKKNNLIPLFIKKILNHQTCYINGSGNQTRDFIYIDDLCNAINSCVINKNIAGQIFQIASGKQTSVNKVTKLITKNIEKLGIYNPKIKYTKSRKGDVPKNYSNIDKAQLLLKWSPKMHLNLGISNTINFFLNEKKI